MSNWTEDQKNAQIEDLPEVKNEGVEIPAKRHGCVTAWWYRLLEP
jgi:hypothetical protein